MIDKKFRQLCFFPIFVLIGCMAHLQPNEKVAYDTGYIDNDTLHLVVKVTPSLEAEGLVAQRESAQVLADKNLNELLAKELARFCINQNKHNIPQPEPAQAQSTLNDKNNCHLKIASIAKSGRIVAKFFDEDNSLIITCRMKKNGLRGTIDDLANGILAK